MAEEYIYKGKKIGIISGNRITMFKSEKDIYHNLNSIGIGEPIINDLITNGIEDVVMIFKKEDKTETLFKTLITDWKFGKVVQHGKFEVQRHLTLAQLEERTNTLTK